MRRLIGLAVFLLALYGVLLLAMHLSGVLDKTLSANNANLARRVGQYGIISLGVTFVIIIGGIDLSIGSVVALSATVLAIVLIDPAFRWSPWLAIPMVLLLGAGIGLIHGLLITKVRLPAFVVTLCGLFIYRGVARTIASNQSKGLGDEYQDLVNFFTEPVRLVETHELEILLPRFLILFLILAVIAAVVLHKSVFGRYLYAIGNNEQAVRYAGIPADRYKIYAYVICSTLAALFGVLFLMRNNSVRPSADGSFFELYAIAGAVLGGCSLRGGQGTVIGVAIGTAILWILPNLTNMWGVPSELEFVVIGGSLLVGAILDELLRPRSSARV